MTTDETARERQMNSDQLADHLQFLLEQSAEGDTGDFCDETMEGCRTTSYRDAGVLTMDKGFVLHMEDGSEYQVTVIQSRVKE